MTGEMLAMIAPGDARAIVGMETGRQQWKTRPRNSHKFNFVKEDSPGPMGATTRCRLIRMLANK